MIFYALLPPADGLSFLHFLGIYIAAYMAGLAANVPGGIGVFDGAILFALAGFMPTPAVVGALLLFRLFYYIIPLFLAGALFAGFEISQRRKLVARLAPDRGIAVSFEVSALAGLTGLAALALIFIGALPPKPSLLGPVPDILEEAASHFAASVVGSLLLAAAYGLVRRLTLAWWASIFLLLNGVLILVLRGEPLWLIAAFLLVPLLLMTARAAFYRRAQLIGEAISADGLGALAAGAICGLTLATVAYQSDLADRSWWGVVLAADAPESLRFTVGLAAVLLLVAAFRLLLPARPPSMAYTEAARERLLALGGMAPGLMAADGAVFGEAGRAGFAFLRRDGVWLALGDPVGEPRDRVSAIWRFRDLCEAAQVDPAFWRVGPELLRIYSDIGLTALALEPDGTAPRYLVCRAERDLDNLRALLPHGGAGGEVT
jgi:phosphatidylglycerol lysyltransferase